RASGHCSSTASAPSAACRRSSARSTSCGPAGSTATSGRSTRRRSRAVTLESNRVRPRFVPRATAGTLCCMAQVGGTLEKALRFGEGRRMKRLVEQAAYITSLEPQFQELSDSELRAKTGEFRARLGNAANPEDLLFEAYAAEHAAR